MSDPQEQETETPEKKESIVESMMWVVDMMNNSKNPPRREDIYPANRYHGD